MARKNPVIEDLKEQLRKATLKADNNQELHQRALGKLEKYEQQEEREKEDRMMMVREREEYTRRLESDVAWMRRLVEFLCIPADKLKTIQEFKDRVEITGEDPRHRPGRGY